jgi:hypothetical protein
MIALLALLLLQKAEVRLDEPPTAAQLDALKARGINTIGLAARKDLDGLFNRGVTLHLVLGADWKEMVARYAKQPGILWSIPDEGTDAEQRARVAEIQALSKHPISVTRKCLVADDLQIWPHLGFKQFGWISVRVGESEDPAFAVWANREKSEAMSHPLPVSVDGLIVDTADDAARFKWRSQVVYPVYLSGGGLGVKVAKGAEAALDDLGRACRLVSALPFAGMAPQNGLLSDVSGNFCLAKEGGPFAIYLTKGSEIGLDLRAATGKFKVTWRDVRSDKSAPGPEVEAGDWRSLGKPPYPGDVAAVVTR